VLPGLWASGVDGHGRAEGQHALQVHRPNADAHRNGAAGQPSQANPTLGGSYASGEVERGIRRSMAITTERANSL